MTVSPNFSQSNSMTQWRWLNKIFMPLYFYKFNWRHAWIIFSLAIIFSWSVVCAMDPIIMIISLTPAFVIMILLLRGSLIHKLGIILSVFILALFLNITSTKHSLFYPIASEGHFTVSARWSPVVWNNNYNNENGKLYFTRDFSTLETASAEHKDKKCDLTFLGESVKIGTPIKLKVFKQSSETEWGLPYSYVGYGINSYYSYSVFIWLDSYSYGCYSFNKPLVRDWVIVVNETFNLLVMISYPSIIIILVYRHREKRRTLKLK
jgi:hypothetical protein